MRAGLSQDYRKICVDNRFNEGKSFSLALQEVDALTLFEIKEGNILLDLGFRKS